MSVDDGETMTATRFLSGMSYRVIVQQLAARVTDTMQFVDRTTSM